MTIKLLTYTLIPPIIVFALFKLAKQSKKLKPSIREAVLITGCDSGIGYTMACHCQKIGMTVLAGCFDLQSTGSLHLQTLKNICPIQLDVTDENSIRLAVATVNEFLKNSDIVLKTLINNAGVMIFGEFAWQPSSLIEKQLKVNLVGAMNVTNAVISQIIRNEGRIINICSHCSLSALPGLSVYAASKSGLLIWSDALRVELKKFNVSVISFIPGAFPLETNILSKQKEYAEEMRQNMAQDDWNFYKRYFTNYNSYLSGLGCGKLAKLKDPYFYSLFEKVLLDETPSAHYCSWPRRYFIYHLLFKILPTCMSDPLLIKFVNMPKWEK